MWKNKYLVEAREKERNETEQAKRCMQLQTVLSRFPKNSLDSPANRNQNVALFNLERKTSRK